MVVKLGSLELTKESSLTVCQQSEITGEIQNVN